MIRILSPLIFLICLVLPYLLFVLPLNAADDISPRSAVTDNLMTLYSDKALIRELRLLQNVQGSMLRITGFPDQMETDSLRLYLDNKAIRYFSVHDHVLTLADLIKSNNQTRVTAKHLQNQIQLTGILIFGDEHRVALNIDSKARILNLSDWELIFDRIPSGGGDTYALLKSDELTNYKQLIVEYAASSINWYSRYYNVLNEQGVHISAKAVVSNRSVQSYDNVKLKLVSKLVAKHQKQRHSIQYLSADSQESSIQAGTQSVGDVYTFDLPSPISLGEFTDVHIELLSHQVNNSKRYYTYHFQSPTYKRRSYLKQGVNPETTLEFAAPSVMPAGIGYFYQKDKQGHLIEIGETFIAFSSKGKILKLDIGKAVDIHADHRRVNFNKIDNNNYRETWKLSIKNTKTTKAYVNVIHDFKAPARIVDHGADGTQKLSDTTYQFSMSLKPNTLTTFQYVMDIRDPR